MNGEYGIPGTEQHYSAAVKVYVARAACCAVAAPGATDLLDHVRREAGFVAIDFGNAAFENDAHFGGCAWRDGLAQGNAQYRALIVERSEERRVGKEWRS